MPSVCSAVQIDCSHAVGASTARELAYRAELGQPPPHTPTTQRLI